MIQHDMIQHDMSQHDMNQHDMHQHDIKQCQYCLSKQLLSLYYQASSREEGWGDLGQRDEGQSHPMHYTSKRHVADCAPNAVAVYLKSCGNACKGAPPLPTPLTLLTPTAVTHVMALLIASSVGLRKAVEHMT